MTSITQPLASRVAVGRFAPSPTGPLHFGSLVAAMGSYLEARAQGGRWLVRIEDVDVTRTQSGSAQGILRTLAAFGFEWDGEVVYQSVRTARYAAALVRLQEAGIAYRCTCSRREVAQRATRRAADGGWCYPGHCRPRDLPPEGPGAWRVQVPAEPVAFTDRVQSHCVQHLADEVGDFVVRRADGLFAYQLAVVVDDAEQGVTDVVRGADLLDSTARQIHLYRALGWPVPHFAHLPVVVNAAGEKLSKQTYAEPVSSRHATRELLAVLRFLGQAPPPTLDTATLAEVWAWAFVHWDLRRVPARRAAMRDG